MRRSTSLPASASRLAGREREQTILHEHLSIAHAGRGSLVLISGEAGVGKTVLMQAVTDAVTDTGVLVLIGRCYDLTETPPYGPWREILTQVRSLAATHPDLAGLSEPDVTTVANQTAFFQQGLAFFTALTERHPLVLVLDDLHWADPASLEFLRFLSRSIYDLPLLILVAYRGDELLPRDALYSLVPLLERESLATVLELRRLDQNAVRELVAANYDLDDASVTRLVIWLSTRANGNGLFITQLLRALEEEGGFILREGRWMLGDLTQMQIPMRLRQIVAARMVKLDDEAQYGLAIAAMLGQDVAFTRWAAVMGSGEELPFAIAEAAISAHLIEPTADGTGFRFIHALVREALYEGMLPFRRRSLHGRIGAALAALPDPDPDTVAFHFQRAGDARGVEWFIRAGERAERAYALATAAERYDAALALMGATSNGADPAARGWVLVRFAHVWRYSNPHAALTFTDEAVRIAETLHDRGLRAAAVRMRGIVRCFRGNVRLGVRDLEEIVAAIDALTPEERAHFAAQFASSIGSGNGQGILTFWLGFVGRVAETRAWGERLLIERAALTTHIARYHANDFAYAGLAHAYVTVGLSDEGKDAFAQFRSVFEDLGDYRQIYAVLGHEICYSHLAYRADDLAERQRLSDEAERVRSAVQGTQTFPPQYVAQPLLFLEGNWGEIDTIQTVMQESGLIHGVHEGWAGVRGLLARARGQTDEAWQCVHRFFPDGPATEPGNSLYLDALPVLRLAAALALDVGDHARARDWLEAHDRWLLWGNAVLGHAEGHTLWACHARATGVDDDARAHAEQARICATAPRQPLALLAAHRSLGEIETDARRYDVAGTHLDAALALADACAAPHERALTLLARAELHAATGAEADTLAALEAASEIAVPLGAQPVLAQITALAARLHPPTAPDAPALYPAGITERESEVLWLLAQGISNPEIAERLFLSRRTVENHLRSIYRKLDITSRAAAVRFAVDHGLA